MSFDETPENQQESFQCECGGSIKLNPETDKYECDTCEFVAEQTNKR